MGADRGLAGPRGSQARDPRQHRALPRGAGEAEVLSLPAAPATATPALACADFVAGRCRSCGWIGRSQAAQLADKADSIRALLGLPTSFPVEVVASPPSGFRNKAKMVVTGSVESPSLGLAGGVDLCGCPLYPSGLTAAFGPLKQLIREAALAPYDIALRSGELKYLLVTLAPDGSLMARLVLRSRARIQAIRDALPTLLERLPQLAVASVNLQPKPAAVLEGPVEVLLHGEALTVSLNGLRLLLPPGAFFQTHTAMAAALYARVTALAQSAGVRSAVDLYCGIGGFAMHLAAAGIEVLGIEQHPAAIRAARRSAAGQGLVRARFFAGDSLASLTGHPSLASFAAAADAWVVNPPRRGLGPELCARLAMHRPAEIFYSSCHPASLAADLDRLPGYRVASLTLFDMFPHTAHVETLVHATRERTAKASAAGG